MLTTNFNTPGLVHEGGNSPSPGCGKPRYARHASRFAPTELVVVARGINQYVATPASLCRTTIIWVPLENGQTVRAWAAVPISRLVVQFSDWFEAAVGVRRVVRFERVAIHHFGERGEPVFLAIVADGDKQGDYLAIGAASAFHDGETSRVSRLVYGLEVCFVVLRERHGMSFREMQNETTMKP